jgi:organic hydroperoxide reductase OsmC/OhrA
MQAFPHRYDVSARGLPDGEVELRSARLPVLSTASPEEFGGPGDQWSPETLLVGSIADCFILTFRAVAQASGVAWTSLECEARGTLDRVDRAPQFTAVVILAHLIIPDGVSEGLARRALEKAERACLITSSLKASVQLEATVDSIAVSAARSR